MLAKWILILTLASPCSDYRCTDTVAISQVGPFETRAACLTAANLAQKHFTRHGRVAIAACVSTQ